MFVTERNERKTFGVARHLWRLLRPAVAWCCCAATPRRGSPPSRPRSRGGSRRRARACSWWTSPRCTSLRNASYREPARWRRTRAVCSRRRWSARCTGTARWFFWTRTTASRATGTSCGASRGRRGRGSASCTASTKVQEAELGAARSRRRRRRRGRDGDAKRVVRVSARLRGVVVDFHERLPRRVGRLRRACLRRPGVPVRAPGREEPLGRVVRAEADARRARRRRRAGKTPPRTTLGARRRPVSAAREPRRVRLGARLFGTRVGTRGCSVLGGPIRVSRAIRREAEATPRRVVRRATRNARAQSFAPSRDRRRRSRRIGRRTPVSARTSTPGRRISSTA